MLQAICSIPSKKNVQKLAAQYQLISQLKYYGLDPDEWKFESLQWKGSKDSATAALIHRRDNNVRIKGCVRNRFPSLKNQFFWQWTDLAWDL